MQSLAVSNLPGILTSYKSISDELPLQNQHYIKSNENPNNKSNKTLNKFNLKFNLKTISNSINKYSLSRNDSGYLSAGSGNSSVETVFSIDSSNYVSFRQSPGMSAGNGQRQQYSSTQSLYDRSLLDLNEVFGLNLNLFNNKIQNQQNLAKNRKLLSLSAINGAKVSVKSGLQTKYENRSWDQIYSLSDVALNLWLRPKASHKQPINQTFVGNNSFEYFEPNIDSKNSLLLNRNLLYQPIRRYTSEINLRKLLIESSELFWDDFQLDSNLIPDENPNADQNGGDSKPNNTIAADIYDLFMDLHEFRISDQNIDSVSDKICKIDKYLFRRIRAKDFGNYLFGRNLCGCRLQSICSVIKFSQHLSQIVVDCIDGKIAVYQRIAYIIAFIKLSISLYQKSNWQSLNTIVCALHTFRIYRLNSEWIQIKHNYKHYFDEFQKLTTIIRSSETSLMYTIPRGIPALRNLLLTKQIDCLSKWDRIERPAKWVQSPGIIDWLERELKYTLKSIRNRNYCLEESDVCVNPKQFICLIPINKLPENWLKRSVRNIPLEYRDRIYDYLRISLKIELKLE